MTLSLYQIKSGGLNTAYPTHIANYLAIGGSKLVGAYHVQVYITKKQPAISGLDYERTVEDLACGASLHRARHVESGTRH